MFEEKLTKFQITEICFIIKISKNKYKHSDKSIETYK